MRRALAVRLIGSGLMALLSFSMFAENKRWIVVYHQQSSLPASAERDIARAGGSVLARLPEIGVIVATSSRADFAAATAADPKVSDVAEDVDVQFIPTPQQMGLENGDAVLSGDGPVQPPGDDTQTGPEPFYPFQWDKKRMRASNQGSYAVQQGRPDVVVAVLDTGGEAGHPDIAPNLDAARSRSFFPVQPNPDGDPNPAAWDDRNGHGSWCLSAVAAPINGIGMVGVAPRVRLVALKVLGDTGSGSFVSLAQALIYCGVNKFDVASMSLSNYLRRANQGSHALIKLVQRAVNFARTNGVTPIAAMSNEAFDVSDGEFFRDFITVPAEIDGVIGVSATGYFNLKASYSNYGVGKTDISAPGGDYAVQAPGANYPGLGSVLGAWAPDNTALPGAMYVFASGTSMACPNAAGVCALIISQYGDFTPDNSRKPHLPPQTVEAILQRTANNQPCPEPREVTYFALSPPFPAGTQVGPADQRCQGDAGYNNFYGKGIVDALKAVTNQQ
ncbi:MAG TPA: S8 family serine peptidase [Thermoanaerobaculia bacterium]|nr:S8 family serine peptidase [Thermoanaerobaculia bacterium]